MAPALQTAFFAAVEVLVTWKGRLVEVEAVLARGTSDGWEYDRHGCTWTRFVQIVEVVACRFSGAALHVDGALGDQVCGHEVSMDALVGVRQLESGSVAFKERFGRAAERVSVFRLVPVAQEAEPGESADGRS